jgi:hypothetical protein
LRRRDSVEHEPCSTRVFVEHLYCLQGILVEALPHKSKLLEDVVRDGDDVAADGVGLEDVEQLARARPDELGVRLIAKDADSFALIRGTGSRPVSAMRPAKTETLEGAPPFTAFITSRT